jgi:hypothetical protein
MDAHQTNHDERLRELERDVARYRAAATSALKQLEWIVGYLHQIRKSEIAGVLEGRLERITKEIR